MVIMVIQQFLLASKSQNTKQQILQKESLSMFYLQYQYYQDKYLQPTLFLIYIMIFNICFLAKTFIDLSFVPIHYWLPFIFSLAFYFLALYFNSVCTNPQLTLTYSNNRRCSVCNHYQIIRMKHCEICNRCIHKYDHHCKLMQVCIGQFNHKYYLGFLLSYIVSQILVDIRALIVIRDEVEVDENGIQSVSWKYYILALQLCLYGLVIPLLCCFLLFRHLRLISNNSTTWEEGRREQITYLQNLPKSLKYPFSEGMCRNLCLGLSSNRQNVSQWQLPIVR